ncbi:MAG: TVP38/TMEM64 family protein [Clostridiaceae bacterium]|nr:TVP38/TMEM64 family protein [Clostridiaceae bacterium]
MNKRQRHTLFKSILAISALVAGIALSVRYLPLITRLAKNPDAFAEYIASFGYGGYLVFVLLEIIQVVIAVIPGDIFHITAGYIFRMPLGFLLAYGGEAAGAVIAFLLARLFGEKIVSRFVQKEQLERMGSLLNSAGGIVGTLVLCLIPAVPKDVLVYAAGITPIKPSRFLTVFLLCRIPDILVKSGGGAAFSRRDYAGLIVVMLSFLALLGIGYILKKRFIDSQRLK